VLHVVDTIMTNKIPMPGKDVLHRLYIEDGKSMGEVGRVLGTSPATIRNWMSEYGMKSRSSSESLLHEKLRPSDQELYDMPTIESIVETDNMETNTIADERSCKFCGVVLSDENQYPSMRKKGSAV